MRNKKNKHLGLEIDPETHFKLSYISKYEGRSINGQVLYLIRKCIREFEKMDGAPIKVELDTEPTEGLGQGNG